jgi:hypothetical protein
VLRIKSSWEIKASVNADEVIPVLLWQKPEAALKELISQYPFEEEISVSLWPKWWSRFPILPNRLQVTIVD